MVVVNDFNLGDIIVLRFGSMSMGEEVNFQYLINDKNDDVLDVELICPQPCSTYWYIGDRRVPAIAHQKKTACTLSIDEHKLNELLVEHLPKNIPEVDGESVANEELSVDGREGVDDSVTPTSEKTVETPHCEIEEIVSEEVVSPELTPVSVEDVALDADEGTCVVPVGVGQVVEKVIAVDTKPYTEQQQVAIKELKKSVSPAVRLAQFLAKNCNMTPQGGLDAVKLAAIMEARGISIDQLVYGDEMLELSETCKAA